MNAIHARSQLRYRPKLKANSILPEAFGNVNANLKFIGKALEPAMVALIQVLLSGTEETRLSTRLFSFYFFIPE